MAGDPQTEAVVKKTLMSTLKGFHQQYQSDRSMRIYAEWWDAVGGARGVSIETGCSVDPTDLCSAGGGCACQGRLRQRARET